MNQVSSDPTKDLCLKIHKQSPYYVIPLTTLTYQSLNDKVSKNVARETKLSASP